MNANEYVLMRLEELKDEKYKEFQSKLIPTIDKEKIIGVRTPALKKLAKEIYTGQYKDDFLNCLPHFYYDENALHAFVIMNIDDFDEAMKQVSAFLLFVDNWATCDQLSPKIFKENPTGLLESINLWLSCNALYTRRFAVNMLMKYFLDEKFNPQYLKAVAALNCDEYYMMMAVAWYFATALAKQYDCAIKIIEQNFLDKKTHNKTIQKACESFRINDEQKAYLKTLKRK